MNMSSNFLVILCICMRLAWATLFSGFRHPSVSMTVPASDQTALLRAAASKLPPGATVTRSQLQSVMGLYARDLCGASLSDVPGSFEAALECVFGLSQADSLATDPLRLPSTPVTWHDCRPPPPPSTRDLGELFPGTSTWLTNEPERCDAFVRDFGMESAPHIGLDAEWTPCRVQGQQSKVELLQLATPTHCLLVRVCQMERLPEGLRLLLRSETPLKVQQDTGSHRHTVS